MCFDEEDEEQKQPFVIPEGFEPVLSYADDEVNGTPKSGLVSLTKLPDGFKVRDRALEFEVDSKIPALPLLAVGEAWFVGWDIPTRWAIDANKQCWKDNAHGHPLQPCSEQELLGEYADDECGRNTVRAYLGLSPEEPSWMRMARAAGWTPPEKKS